MTQNPEPLGFILAIDNCGRGCTHCPAHGLRKKMETAPLVELKQRLSLAKQALRGTDVLARRTIHSWRIGDMTDYRDRDPATGQEYTVVDVADAWLTELGQPHYTVTNGTMGVEWRQNALQQLAENPELSSQVKLTITPFDPKFHRASYVTNLAHDVATLWPLTELESQRPESVGQLRFRVNAKATPDTTDQLLDTLHGIVRESGVPVNFDDVVKGTSEHIKIKPVYDLRATAEQVPVFGAISLGNTIKDRVKPEEVRDRYQLGVRTNGRAFEVDLYNFSEADLHNDDGSPVMFEDILNKHND